MDSKLPQIAILGESGHAVKGIPARMAAGSAFEGTDAI